MRTICVLAARPPEEGKSRLADSLIDSERYRLNINMFNHVLDVACKTFGTRSLLLVTRSPDLASAARAAGVDAIEESATDLNSAFAQARGVATHRGAERLVTLSCDLPYLDVADLEALLAAPGEVVIAPDRHGTGTNALALCPPDAIEFFYGPDSYRRHFDAAIRQGRTVNAIDRPGLARDVDLPAELRELLDGQG